MSRDAKITFPWGAGDTTFALRLGEVIKLQEARDAGPKYLFDKLLSGQWRVEDVIETIRWGLIGGGATPVEAAKLIKLYVEGRPLLESIAPAIKILGAALSGAPDEPPLGEADAPNPAEGSGSTTSPATS